MLLVCSSSIFDIVMIDDEFMYEFAKLSPSAVTVKERLCGIIKKELGITVNPKYDIFKGFSERQGAELIDTIKRYVRAEKRRKERTDGKIKT